MVSEFKQADFVYSIILSGGNARPLSNGTTLRPIGMIYKNRINN